MNAPSVLPKVLSDAALLRIVRGLTAALPPARRKEFVLTMRDLDGSPVSDDQIEMLIREMGLGAA